MNRLTWVFAHGSLMFDPDFEPAVSMPGRVWGWERYFGQPSVRNWGTTAAPAPTSSLVPGSFCDGVALALPPDESATVLGKLVEREAQPPVTVRVELDDGDLDAHAWPMTPRWHTKSIRELVIAAVANIAEGGGPRGNAWEYVDGVRTSLARLSLVDDHVDAYHAALRASIDDRLDHGLSPAENDRPPSTTS